MIDIEHEQLIPIRDVPGWLPRRPNGRKIHISAVYRWVQRGSQGVRLDSIKIGGSTYTSVEALQRFADELSRGDATRSGPVTRDRSKHARRAREEVQRLLYPERRGKKQSKAGDDYKAHRCKNGQ